VGNNAEAARLVGIATQRVLLGVYVAAGVLLRHRLAAVGGAHRRRRPERGPDREPRRITAVVLGGTSLFGGRGASSAR
jgi:fructose transport system permease protein